MSIAPQPKTPVSFAALLEAVPDAVVVHDLEYQVLSWNQAAEKLYGWKAKEMLGRSVVDILYPDPKVRETALRELKQAGVWDGELKQINKQNREFLVRVHQKLHCDFSGRPIAIISFHSRSAWGSAETTGRGAHHVRSSSLFSDGVAHELNNALAPIMLSSAMLKRSVKNDKAKGMVAMIEKCATKGAKLINEVLYYERGKGGGDDLIPKTQILRALQRAKDCVMTSQVRLDVTIAEDLWEFTGNLNEIEGVCKHLMQNACESMPDGGLLTVEVSNYQGGESFSDLLPDAEGEAYVSIAFTDTGVGISDEIMDRVAEPLFTTKEPRLGFGFGLSRSQAIVKGHKGFMSIRSCPGEGTRVAVYLPASARLAQAEGDPVIDPLEGEGRKVLVADDELSVRETIQHALEVRGYSVITAQDGAEALELYSEKKSEIDLVISNMDMPFLNGPALCEALKKLNPDVRILVSSGRNHLSQVSNAEEIKAMGTEHFLTKPYSADQLAGAVARLLNA
jgi:PAS domain S-box-containing protein